jgi:hypothetical protein
MDILPTSDIETFKKQLSNPNKNISGQQSIQRNVSKVKKNLLLSYVSDSAGCGHIRNIFPMMYMNAVFTRGGNLIPVVAPFFMHQHDILIRTRAIFFQRQMSFSQLPHVMQYKNNQEKYGYKMVYDFDDFIWSGPDDGERIPSYNQASINIKDENRKSSIEIMNQMNTVCVSTEFLKMYLSTHGVNRPIEVINNTVPKFFWGGSEKGEIKEKIKKPKVIYTGSPTHYSNERKLKGDWENEWAEWVIKSVLDNKIDFVCMGGLPFFFERIKSKITVVDWVNSFQYHVVVKSHKPDFGIAPLVPNYFNYSKSDIKHIEHCAVGAVSIGTYFTNGKPSPYDNNFVKVPDNITIDGIDEIFDEYTEPERYNEIIKRQYKMLDDDGRWLESPKFINKLASLF